MSPKLLKYLIFIWGGLSLCAFLAIRYESVFNGFLREDVVEGYWDRTKYGELYYFSMIRHFREDGLPEAKQKFEHTEKQASVSDCQILVFGDSFFEFSRHRQFPEILAEDFNKRVHFVNSDHPLEYLHSIGYKDTIPKLVFLERTERYIPVAFQDEQALPATPVEEVHDEPIWKYVLGKLFYAPSEELYDVMMKRSHLSTDLYSIMATLKFDLYGKISRLTPVYLKDGENSWLFYHDQVNEERTSFYYPFSHTQIDSICDHMDKLARDLQSMYNMTLLYLPLPAKYTLYHHVLNNDQYNMLLPELYRGLEQRDVKHVQVLEDFRNSSNRLFYRTDSHWNQEGIDLTYNKTLKYIENDSTLRPLLFKN